MTFLVAYDGTPHSKRALRYGLRRARTPGAEVRVLSVFDRGVHREDEGIEGEEPARRDWCRRIEEAIDIVDEEGGDLAVNIITSEGDPVEEVIRYAETERVDTIIASPHYRTLIGNAPCPVWTIPGNVLVPVDNTENSLAIADVIVREAQSTGSRVILLGLVPIHLYNCWEKKELREIRKETLRMVRRMRQMLRREGIATEVVIRSGYFDEEILGAADEYQASLIMLAGGGQRPSELTKAARIVIDAPERPARPVLLVESMVPA